MKLGKAPARHDPRTLRLARYLVPAQLPPVPERLDYSALVRHWGLYANDRYGDCTCAAAGHALQLVAALSSAAHRQIIIEDSAILRAYRAITGGVDQGAVMLDVLHYWRHVGIAGRRVYAYAALDLPERSDVFYGLLLFGGVYAGLALPTSAQRQLGTLWDDVGDAPGSWGGHAVELVAADPDGLTCITWGAPQRLSWRFWQRYADEAYALVPRQWHRRGRLTGAAGLDWDTLLADLAAIGTPSAHDTDKGDSA